MCDLSAAQSLVSHHLKVLREAGLVESERYPYWTYYRLYRDRLAEVAGRVDALARSGPTPRTTRSPCC